jgi:hypothetical protein
MDAVVSSMVFFYNLGKELSIAMTKYLEEEGTLEGLTASQTSIINGVGINQYKHLADLM